MRLLLFTIPFFLFACGTTNRIQRYAQQQVLNDSALLTAHVGISVYEPATGKYLYNYQGDKYFVPASNTKIPTCYAAMKYLGDSLVGLKAKYDRKWIYLKPTGDPTFLHKDFKHQAVLNFLRNSSTDMYFIRSNDYFDALGSGWSWNDYNAGYMAERSVFPIYGNTYQFYYQSDSLSSIPTYPIDEIGLLAEKTNALYTTITLLRKDTNSKFSLVREINSNEIHAVPAAQPFREQLIPLRTDDQKVTYYLKQAIHTKHLLGNLQGVPQAIYSTGSQAEKDRWLKDPYNNKDFFNIHSQPTDSLLRPMMHRSDNFFAEQSLLMVSNEHLGYMSDAAIIDTLLKTDFKNLPQKPRWADGSGLSRYNLFTPQDFVFILNKMKTDFGMARIKDILPTGGEGTLSSYYVSDSSFIYAKTGTLSGVVALSGFLYTQKGKELIFSILVNNHQGSATAVRRAVERFVKQLRKDF